MRIGSILLRQPVYGTVRQTEQTDPKYIIYHYDVFVSNQTGRDPNPQTDPINLEWARPHLIPTLEELAASSYHGYPVHPGRRAWNHSGMEQLTCRCDIELEESQRLCVLYTSTVCSNVFLGVTYKTGVSGMLCDLFLLTKKRSRLSTPGLEQPRRTTEVLH